jgi:hypothetical protein
MGIGVVLVQARPKVEPTSVARIEVDATTADTDALHSAFEARVTAAPSVTGPSAVSSSLLIAPRAAPSLTVAPAAPVSTAKSHIDRRRLEGENPY